MFILQRSVLGLLFSFPVEAQLRAPYFNLICVMGRLHGTAVS